MIDMECHPALPVRPIIDVMRAAEGKKAKTQPGLLRRRCSIGFFSLIAWIFPSQSLTAFLTPVISCFYFLLSPPRSFFRLNITIGVVGAEKKNRGEKKGGILGHLLNLLPPTSSIVHCIVFQYSHGIHIVSSCSKSSDFRQWPSALIADCVENAPRAAGQTGRAAALDRSDLFTAHTSTLAVKYLQFETSRFYIQHLWSST